MKWKQAAWKELVEQPSGASASVKRNEFGSEPFNNVCRTKFLPMCLANKNKKQSEKVFQDEPKATDLKRVNVDGEYVRQTNDRRRTREQQFWLINMPKRAINYSQKINFRQIEARKPNAFDQQMSEKTKCMFAVRFTSRRH